LAVFRPYFVHFFIKYHQVVILGIDLTSSKSKNFAMLGRREFLNLTLKNAFLITAGRQFLPFFPEKDGLPDASRVALRFALASDGHYGQPDTDHVGKHELVVRALNGEKSGRGLDFTVINGDLFHNEPTLLAQVKQTWDGLGTKWYPTHGNHDMITETEWQKQLGHGWYYGFEQGNAGFVVLNTATEKGDYVCPEMNQARTLLDQYAQKEHLFVFMHITPLHWTGGSLDCPELVNEFSRRKNLRAVFHGHDHDQEAAFRHEGISYLFDAHVAGNWGTNYSGYRIVELMHNGDIISYQMNATAGTEVNRNSLGVMRGA
jgi:3',5'-cyclic-AMP phosphodiesterase